VQFVVKAKKGGCAIHSDTAPISEALALLHLL